MTPCDERYNGKKRLGVGMETNSHKYPVCPTPNNMNCVYLLQFGSVCTFDDGSGNILVIWTAILCSNEHHLAIGQAPSSK